MQLIYQDNGQEFSITLPEHVSEVTYSKLLDWRKPIETFVRAEIQAQEKIRAKELPKEITAENFHLFADGGEAPEVPKDEPTYLLNTFKYFLVLIDMEAHMERPEILEVLQTSLKAIIPESLEFIPIHSKEDNIADLLENGVDWFDGGEITLARLLCHLCCFFRNYIASAPTPDKRASWEYKGETYYIEPDAVQRVYANQMVGQTGKTYTVDEVNEISETQRIFQQRIEEIGDPDGALEFQMDLVLLAVLLRKDGERLPSKRIERTAWIDVRSQYFKELPMDVVYGVKAFFLRTLTGLLSTIAVGRILEMGQASPNLTPGATVRTIGRRSGTPKKPQKSFTRRLAAKPKSL